MPTRGRNQASQWHHYIRPSNKPSQFQQVFTPTCRRNRKEARCNRFAVIAEQPALFVPRAHALHVRGRATAVVMRDHERVCFVGHADPKGKAFHAAPLGGRHASRSCHVRLTPRCAANSSSARKCRCGTPSRGQLLTACGLTCSLAAIAALPPRRAIRPRVVSVWLMGADCGGRENARQQKICLDGPERNRIAFRCAMTPR